MTQETEQTHIDVNGEDYLQILLMKQFKDIVIKVSPIPGSSIFLKGWLTGATSIGIFLNEASDTIIAQANLQKDKFTPEEYKLLTESAKSWNTLSAALAKFMIENPIFQSTLNTDQS